MTSRLHTLNLSPFRYRHTKEHQRYHRHENNTLSLAGCDDDDDDEVVSYFSKRSIQPTQLAGMQKLFMKKFSTFRGRLKLQRLNNKKKNAAENNNDDDDDYDYSSFGSLQTMASSDRNQKLKKVSPFLQRFRNLRSDKKKTDAVADAAEYLLGPSETTETSNLDDISSPPDVIFFRSSSSEEEEEFGPSATRSDELLLPPLSMTGEDEVEFTASTNASVEKKKELSKKVDQKKKKKKKASNGLMGVESTNACCNPKAAEVSAATTKAADDHHKFGKGDKLMNMVNTKNATDVIGESSFNFKICFDTEDIGSWFLEVYLYVILAYVILSVLPATLLFK